MLKPSVEQNDLNPASYLMFRQYVLLKSKDLLHSLTCCTRHPFCMTKLKDSFQGPGFKCMTYTPGMKCTLSFKQFSHWQLVNNTTISDRMVHHLRT